MVDSKVLQQRSESDRVAGYAVFGALFLVYLLTASLTFIGTDEWFLFDTAESFARRGSVMRNITADLDWPGHTYVEPVLPLLSVPLILLADNVRGIGVSHTTLLLNAVVTAATGMVLFLYGRRLDYGRGVAIALALLFGMTTIAWPYSKNYFREPASGLALLLAAYGLLRWRQGLRKSDGWPHYWLLLSIFCVAVSILAKESSAIGVPFLMLILLVGRGNMPRSRREIWQLGLMIVVLVGLAVAGLYAYTNVLGAAIFRFHPIDRVLAAYSNLRIAGEGILGFLISPGKGVFWHSPVIVFALAAPWLANRERRLDTSWPLLLFGAFVTVYAFVRGAVWFGGTNWGPRYLVPVVPLLMLGVAPALQRCVLGNRKNAWRIVVVLFALLGLAVQCGAVWVNPLDYYAVLDETGIRGAPWTVALWSPLYAPIVGHWSLMLSGATADFAWVKAGVNGPDWVVAIAILVSLVGLGCLLLQLTRMNIGRLTAAVSSFCLFIVLVGLTWLGLTRLYVDQRYQGENAALHTMRTELETTVLPEPVIFLNNRTYFDHMLNYYKGEAIWYTLELNSNEMIPSNSRAPDPSIDPFNLLNPDAWSPVDYFGRQHKTVVLVMESGIYHPNIVRPLDWWMNTEFHRIIARDYADDVHAISFSTVSAPSREEEPEFRLESFFGDAIALRGYDPQPPPGLVRPGSILNLSMQWYALQDIDNIYIIGTFLMDPKGSIALQNDSSPLGGFWPTSSWRTGDLVRHNVAFVLPDDLPPGHYELWTVMYSPGDGNRLPVSDARATTIRDHVVLYSVEVAR